MTLKGVGLEQLRLRETSNDVTDCEAGKEKEGQLDGGSGFAPRTYSSRPS